MPDRDRAARTGRGAAFPQRASGSNHTAIPSTPPVLSCVDAQCRRGRPAVPGIHGDGVRSEADPGDRTCAIDPRVPTWRARGLMCFDPRQHVCPSTFVLPSCGPHDPHRTVYLSLGAPPTFRHLAPCAEVPAMFSFSVPRPVPSAARLAIWWRKACSISANDLYLRIVRAAWAATGVMDVTWRVATACCGMAWHPTCGFAVDGAEASPRRWQSFRLNMLDHLARWRHAAAPVFISSTIHLLIPYRQRCPSRIQFERITSAAGLPVTGAASPFGRCRVEVLWIPRRYSGQRFLPVPGGVCMRANGVPRSTRPAGRPGILWKSRAGGRVHCRVSWVPTDSGVH